MLTQRSVDAQQFGADSVNATVEKARAAAKQASDTLRRTEPLLKEVSSQRKTLTAREPRSAPQKPILMPDCCRRSQPPAPSAAWMRWWRNVRQWKRILR